jgi:membrane-bound ClpP family serine protease
LLCLLELVALVLALVVVRWWVAVPIWLIVAICAGWIVKDAVLFPFVWRAYDPDAPGTVGDMVGMSGVAQGRLDPEGYILVRGERWKARREGQGPPIEAGCRVRIERREGLTVFVAAVDDEA